MVNYPRVLIICLWPKVRQGRLTGSHVKNLLFRYGFGFAFEYQKVGDQMQFLCLFKQRLKDNYVQEWTSSTNETSKLKFYCKYKSIFEMEK